ncbi:MAG: hypothetical protein JXA54_01690 [Candidatus Heimdallarchaeota archaeon]|nr:hypothetical protein [Candidatus Heimdallarchaeota archaeon]
MKYRNNLYAILIMGFTTLGVIGVALTNSSTTYNVVNYYVHIVKVECTDELVEPTGSLDFESSKNIWSIILKLKNKNLAIVAVSHNESLIKKANFIHKLNYGIL